MGWLSSYKFRYYPRIQDGAIIMLVDQKLIEQFNQNIRDSSLQEASQNFLQAMDISLDVSGTMPQDGAILLISNHPSVMDPVILSALTQRDDLYLIGMPIEQFMGKAGSQRLFPVYRKWSLEDFFLNILARGPEKHILNDSEELQRRNRQAITDAAAYISEGHILGIFPSGGAGHSSTANNWKAGVGFLAKQITNPSTHLVFVNLNGLNEWAMLRILRPTLRSLLTSPAQVTVSIAEPILLSELIHPEEDGKQSAQTLASAYTELFS